MSISLAIQSALSSLSATQTQIQTTANNIANVNTPGYTRKSVQQTSATLNGRGAGVALSAIKREVDDFLIKQVRTETGRQNKLEVADRFLERIQTLLGAPGEDSSFAHAIGVAATAAEAMALTPENAATRHQFVNDAKQMAIAINRLAEEAQSARQRADQEIGEATNTINARLNEVSTLNGQIARANAVNGSTADLEDQRDRAIDAIAEYIDINVIERSTGETAVFTANGRTLLDGLTQPLSHTAVTTITAGNTYQTGGSSAGSGAIDGIYVGAKIAANDITGSIASGRIAALVEVRDKTMVDFANQLEELASKLVYNVNRAHNAGAAFPPPAALTGTRTVSGSTAIGAAGSGTFSVSIVDASGVVTGAWTSPALNTLADVNALIANFNAAMSPGQATMSIDANGKLNIAAAGSGRVAINEGASQISVSGTNYGASQYFGLNDFFVAGQTATSTVSGSMDVRADIVADPGLASHATLNASAGVGQVGLTKGDGTTAQAIADVFGSDTAFVAAGGLPASTLTADRYAASIISFNATLANNTRTELQFTTTFAETLRFQAASTSGVNLDEELAQITVLEQAFQASARVLQAVIQMLDITTNLGR